MRQVVRLWRRPAAKAWWALGFACLASLGLVALVADGGRAEVSAQTIQVGGNWEASLGQKLAGQAYARGGGPAGLDRNTAALVHRVFDGVARVASAQKQLPYRLEVLSSSQVDGWSYPGGPVYITMGLLRGIDTVDELAGIFGHLLAHQVLGHHFSLLTEEGLEVAKKVAAGQLPATKQGMGKTSLALLSDSFPTFMEKQADQLAASLAARAGYSQGGLELAHAKLARVSRSSPYFRTHPHPDVKPYSQPPSGIAIVPTPPGPPVTPPPGPPITPPSPSASPSGPRILAELGFFAGGFPFRVGAGQADLRYVDDSFSPATVYTVRVYQLEAQTAVSIGTRAALHVADGWAIGLQTGALAGTSVLWDGRDPNKPYDSEAGYLRAGLARRVLGSDRGLGLWVLGEGFAAWWSGQAGLVPVEGTSQAMIVDGHQIRGGTPIDASAFNIGAGAGLRLGGSVFGLSALRWSVTGRYQAALLGGEYVYTAKDYGEETVTIPFENNSLTPFRAAGGSVEVGLALRW